jgi:hypothetical protein
MITFLLYVSVFYLFFLVIGIQFSFTDSFLDGFVEILLSLISFVEHYSFSPVEFYMTRNELFYFYGLLLLVCLVFLEKRFKLLHIFYIYILMGSVLFYYLKKPPSKELFINASKQALVISIIANNEQVILSDNPGTISYLLGDYSLINSISCADTLSMESYYQNEFFSLGDGLVELFNEKLLMIQNEKLKQYSCVDVDVLIHSAYREDVRDLHELFSPSVVVLDAKIYKNSRAVLKEQWLALNVKVVDLSEEAYTRSY